MKLRFACNKCGREVEVALKIVVSNKELKLPEDFENLTFAFKCPNCGAEGNVALEGRLMSLYRAARLRFRNAQKPCMN